MDYNRFAFIPKKESIEMDLDYNTFGFNQILSEEKEEKETNTHINDFSLPKNEFSFEKNENFLEEKNKSFNYFYFNF